MMKIIEECRDCRYCRIDEDTNQPYCKQTYTEVSLESGACDGFDRGEDNE